MENQIDVEAKRHPFRFMFKFLVFAGVLYMAGRILMQKKEEFYGISESEARVKIETKLGPRMGEDKAAELADQIIPKLKEKGVIKADEPHDIVEAAGEKVKDVVDDVVDEAKSAD
ncbi:MAG: hypothetical protein WBM90_01725 [Acidimicrobiia bacterium]